jgi:hypothetical protein
MLSIDNPSSKSAIETFLPNSPLPKNHESQNQNTKQNQSYSIILTSITQKHTSKSSRTINLQQTTTHIYIHTRRRIYLSTNYYSIVFCFWQMKHFPLGLHPRCFHHTKWYHVLYMQRLVWIKPNMILALSIGSSSHKMISCFIHAKVGMNKTQHDFGLFYVSWM